MHGLMRSTNYNGKTFQQRVDDVAAKRKQRAEARRRRDLEFADAVGVSIARELRTGNEDRFPTREIQGSRTVDHDAGNIDFLQRELGRAGIRMTERDLREVDTEERQRLLAIAQRIGQDHRSAGIVLPFTRQDGAIPNTETTDEEFHEELSSYMRSVGVAMSAKEIGEFRRRQADAAQCLAKFRSQGPTWQGSTTTLKDAERVSTELRSIGIGVTADGVWKIQRARERAAQRLT